MKLPGFALPGFVVIWTQSEGNRYVYIEQTEEESESGLFVIRAVNPKTGEMSSQIQVEGRFLEEPKLFVDILAIKQFFSNKVVLELKQRLEKAEIQANAFNIVAEQWADTQSFIVK